QPPPPPPLEKKRLPFYRKTGVLVSVLIILVLSLITISVNDIMKALLHSRAEVHVPNIEGKSILDALSIVSSLNLSLIQDGQEFDESLPAGTILRQHPPSGMKVRTRRLIRVIVSKGGKVVFVPLIIEHPIAEAQSRLAQDGLQIGSINEQFSADFAKGIVISQEPSSGTIVTHGALIDLAVSKGAAPAGSVIVPNFIEKRIDTVEDWAAQLGIKVKMKEDPKAIGRAGIVVKQRPLPDQPLIDEAFFVTIVPLLASEQGFRFSYKVPRGLGESEIRIQARSNRGEYDVYHGQHHGGYLIEVPMDIDSTTRVRVYIDGDLKHERVIEP
ncbi:hypothetical protein BVX98_06750, partial [bacterium F11]